MNSFEQINYDELEDLAQAGGREVQLQKQACITTIPCVVTVIVTLLTSTQTAR